MKKIILLLATILVLTQTSVKTMTPLIKAAKLANFEEAIEKSQKILASGEVNPDDERDRIERTPLMFAAQLRNIELINILLQAKADPNAVNKLGKTPLMFAAIGGDVNSIITLLEAGADLNAITSSGENALDYAIAKKNIPAIRTLLEGYKEPVDVSSLIRAIDQGDLNIIEILLEHGADLNAMGDSGLTPIQIVSNNENVEVIELLGRYTDALARELENIRIGQECGICAEKFGELNDDNEMVIQNTKRCKYNNCDLTQFCSGCLGICDSCPICREGRYGNFLNQE